MTCAEGAGEKFFDWPKARRKFWPNHLGGGGQTPPPLPRPPGDASCSATGHRPQICGKPRDPRNVPPPRGWGRNSIAFGSAPRREADSQPISQLVRQAVSQTVSRASRQADRNTQFGFLQWQTRLSTAGKDVTNRTSDGPMAMQSTADTQVGSSNSRRPTASRAGRPVISAQFDPRSNPSAHKVFTQTFDTPPKK